MELIQKNFKTKYGKIQGITTWEISDILKRMYGHHYSPTTISNISKATKENVAVFHDRTLEANYLSYFLTELTFH